MSLLESGLAGGSNKVQDVNGFALKLAFAALIGTGALIVDKILSEPDKVPLSGVEHPYADDARQYWKNACVSSDGRTVNLGNCRNNLGFYLDGCAVGDLSGECRDPLVRDCTGILEYANPTCRSIMESWAK